MYFSHLITVSLVFPHTTPPDTHTCTQVDLNGDKVMSWHEFTSFLAELVSQLSGSGVDSLLHFLPSRFEDETFHFRPVEYVKYLPGMDKVLVAERSVDFFKIYSKELRLIKECRGHTGGILCGMFRLRESLL